MKREAGNTEDVDPQSSLGQWILKAKDYADRTDPLPKSAVDNSTTRTALLFDLRLVM